MIRCIAIDDEPLALRQLTLYIGRIADLDLVGSFFSVDDAAKLVADREVDLIFLDINMPDCSGTEYARKLGRDAPYIIFTTAYPQYAVEGFRLDAVDYLLKPLSFAEMEEAVEKVRRRFQADQKFGTESADSRALYVKTRGTVRKIMPEDILYIKGLGEYVQIRIRGEKGMVVTLESMRRLEERLRPYGHMRVHRSYIVNLAEVSAATTSQLQMADVCIPVGETYKARFREYLRSKTGL